MNVNRQWLLAKRPFGEVTEANFRVSGSAHSASRRTVSCCCAICICPSIRLREAGWRTGRVTCRLWVSVKSCGRVRWLRWSNPVIRTSRRGIWCRLPGGWQDFLVTDVTPGALGVSKLPPGVTPVQALGVFGITGLTAYFGLLDLGDPKPGETVLVSGAAGATGSVAGQIARIKGCRVIGIAGGVEKCRWLKEVARFDEVIDYKSENVDARIGELCPNKVDVFFDNVGGEHSRSGPQPHQHAGACGAVWWHIRIQRHRTAAGSKQSDESGHHAGAHGGLHSDRLC